MKLLLSTRKGLIVFLKTVQGWEYQQTHFSGIPVTFAYACNNQNIWYACLDHGHWGVKLHRTRDQGGNWEELEAPKYPEGTMIKDDIPATNKYIWAFAQNSNDDLLVGTIPGGLFSSQDNGKSFKLNEALWHHESRKEHWFGGGFDQPGIHSIVIDPEDSNHFFIGISCAGVFETKDGGKSWIVRNEGLRADYLPNPNAEVGHDPHLLLASPSNPSIMWQQNHCGIFRSTDGARSWIDISQQEGPANFGFTIALHERNQEQAWVVPCISDVVRLPIDQSLVVCRTDDGGKKWQEKRSGLPQHSAFDIVYRHALDAKKDSVVFGTTTGNLFISEDLGENWHTISNHLPLIHAVCFV